jgi:membrane-bound inhibitor of C-type lysozyme
MTVRLDGPGAFYNVLAPGAGDVAVYNSSKDMNTWTGWLMKDGDYTVRVYQMRNNARRGDAPYSLRITLHGGNGAKAAPPPKAETKPAAPAPKGDTDMGLTMRYACSGLPVATTLRKTGNDLVLEVRGRALTLAKAKSASGAKFEDAKGNAFWSKGNEATLTLAGEPARKCAQQG